MEKILNILKSYSIDVLEMKDYLTVQVRTALSGMIACGRQHRIYLPFKTSEEHVLDYGTKVPNTIFAVMSRFVKKGEKLHPAEVVYLDHVKRMDLVKVSHGGWEAVQDINLASKHPTIDTAFVCRLWDCMEVDLHRTIQLDKRRIKEKPGSNGFTSTNGSMLYLVTHFSTLGIKRQGDWLMWQDRIMFNRPYDQFLSDMTPQKSQFVDLAAIPQDTSAILQAQMVYGTQIVDHQFVKGPDSAHLSRITSSIPFIEMMAGTRAVVARARYQALKLQNEEDPFIQVAGAPYISGVNVLAARTKEVPSDTFIVSETCAKNKLYSVEEIEFEVTLPANTPFEIHAKVMEPDLAAASKAFNALRNTVNKGAVLVSYFTPGTAVKMIEVQKSPEEIKDGESLTKQVVAPDFEGAQAGKQQRLIRSRNNFVPTEIIVKEDAAYRKLPVTIIQFKGYSVTTAKAGSKAMDLFGSKGTIQVWPDARMPLVETAEGNWVALDMMYSPSIYKRKIGLAVRAEEIISLNSEGAVTVKPDISHKEVIEMIRGKSRMYTVKFSDGRERTLPVGYHFIHHLNHDPRSKFSNGMNNADNGPKLTIIDKMLYHGHKIDVYREDYSKAEVIARSLGYTIDSRGSVPIIVSAAPPADDECIDITKRLERKYLHMEVHLIPKELVEGTVADHRLWEGNMYGRIQAPNCATIYLPPGLMRPIVGHDNSLILTSELHTANAIISEIESLNFQLSASDRKAAVNDKRVDEQKRKIQMRSDVLRQQLFRRLGLYTREGFFPRMKGISGVVVVNNNLGDDEVGIPRAVVAKHFRESQMVMVRRHPIHRKFNSPIMKVRATDTQWVIQLNENVLKMLDGDSDGDLIEVVKVNVPEEVAEALKSSNLLKQWGDISGKKKATRNKIDAELGWAQYTLKTFTALSGGIAIRLGEVAMEQDFGREEVEEVYHATAQHSLNAKHSTDQYRIGLISKISEALLSKRKKNPQEAARLINEYMGWEGTERGHIIEKLCATEPARDLALVRKKVPADFVSIFSKSEYIHDELDTIQSDTLLAEAG